MSEKIFIVLNSILSLITIYAKILIGSSHSYIAKLMQLKESAGQTISNLIVVNGNLTRAVIAVAIVSVCIAIILNKKKTANRYLLLGNLAVAIIAVAINFISF